MQAQSVEYPSEPYRHDGHDWGRMHADERRLATESVRTIAKDMNILRIINWDRPHWICYVGSPKCGVATYPSEIWGKAEKEGSCNTSRVHD